MDFGFRIFLYLDTDLQAHAFELMDLHENDYYYYFSSYINNEWCYGYYVQITSKSLIRWPLAIDIFLISEICETMKTNILCLMTAKSENGKFFNLNSLFECPISPSSHTYFIVYQISQKSKRKKEKNEE